MKQILIQLIIASPALLEANLIDQIYWKNKKSDKPSSTYMRVGLTVLVGIIIQFWIKDNYALLAMLGVVVWYVAIFNYNINLWLGKKMSYKQDWWLFGNPFVKLILLLAFLSIYLTFNSEINQGASLPFNLERFR